MDRTTKKEQQKIAHKELLNYIEELYATKNDAYGDSFSRTYDDIGILSAATQIAHKYNRFINLARNADSNSSNEYESIRDTLIDMANYCLLTVMEIDREEKQKSGTHNQDKDTRKQV